MRADPPEHIRAILPESDERIDAAKDSVEITRPKWVALLLAGRYLAAGSESDMWRRLAEELVHHLNNGGMPPDIHRSLVETARANGGCVPLILSGEDNVLLAPTPDGGMRISTGETAGQEHMTFDELSADELAKLMSESLSTEQFHRLLVRLADLGVFDPKQAIEAVAREHDGLGPDDLRNIADRMDS